MSDVFPTSATEIREFGKLLVQHLRTTADTHGQKDWTSANLEALRSFRSAVSEVKHFPSSADSNQRGAFLWDYVAYQQGSGMLIVAESEHNYKDGDGLKHDFEKLFYAIAPIKLFIFRGALDESRDDKTKNLVRTLRAYMTECCSRFMPGELYILYCRTWKQHDGTSGDRAYLLQVRGASEQFCALSEADQFNCEHLRSSDASA